MYRSRFRGPNPDTQEQFDCPISMEVSPDTLELLLMDSLIRDTLQANGFQYLKETADRYFAQKSLEENSSSEGEKRGLFERMFGRKQDDPKVPGVIKKKQSPTPSKQTPQLPLPPPNNQKGGQGQQQF